MKDDIKIPAWLAAAAVAALVSLACWNLKETVELKALVATLTARVDMHLSLPPTSSPKIALR